MYSALSVVTPADGPLVPLDLLRRHIRIDTDDEDDLLELYLGAATAQAEQFLGRALLTQTFLWVTANVPPPSQYPMVPFSVFILPMWMPYSLLFQLPIEIPRAPVQSVISVSTGQWGESDTLLDTSQYQLDTTTEPGRFQLLNGAGAYPSDHTAVKFVAGYGDTGNSVPRPIVAAVLLMAASLYENRGDVEAEMPTAAKHLLWPYRLMTFGG